MTQRMTQPTTVHARQVRWEGVMRRPYDDPELTATCQSMLQEERFWLATADAIRVGYISPRALDTIRRALAEHDSHWQNPTQ